MTKPQFGTVATPRQLHRRLVRAQRAHMRHLRHSARIDRHADVWINWPIICITLLSVLALFAILLRS